MSFSGNITKIIRFPDFLKKSLKNFLAKKKMN